LLRCEMLAYSSCLAVLYTKQRMINAMPGRPESAVSTVAALVLAMFTFPFREFFVWSAVGPMYGLYKGKGYLHEDDPLTGYPNLAGYSIVPLTGFPVLDRAVDKGTWYVYPLNFAYDFWFRTIFGCVVGQLFLCFLFAVPIARAIVASKSSANAAEKSKKLIRIQAVNTFAALFSSAFGAYAQIKKFVFNLDVGAPWWVPVAYENCWIALESITVWVIFIDPATSPTVMLFTCAPCRAKKASSSSSSSSSSSCS